MTLGIGGTLQVEKLVEVPKVGRRVLAKEVRVPKIVEVVKEVPVPYEVCPALPRAKLTGATTLALPDTPGEEEDSREKEDKGEDGV